MYPHIMSSIWHNTHLSFLPRHSPVWCSEVQCVAACCKMYCRVLQHVSPARSLLSRCTSLQCVARYSTVWQLLAPCCIILQRV